MYRGHRYTKKDNLNQKKYSQERWKQSKERKGERACVLAMMCLLSEEKARRGLRERERWVTQGLPGQGSARFCSETKPRSALSGLQSSSFLTPCERWFHTPVSIALVHKTFLRATLQFWVIRLHAFPSTFSGVLTSKRIINGNKKWEPPLLHTPLIAALRYLL